MNIFIASIENSIGLLNAEESWHCSRVLRNRVGDLVNLIDGEGNFYKGVLETVSDKQCRLKITVGPKAQQKRNYYLHLAIAPTKQMDRIEWLVEKAVEIGVDEVSFMSCKNSERIAIKTERILKVTESAVKQSLQAFIPKINGQVGFKEIVNKNNCQQKLIAHCFDLPKKQIKEINFSEKSTLVLIGPEGDFAKEEIDLASQMGFQSLHLGSNRLRTETAGLYVCQAASILT